jgi:hypothetical protein
MLLSYDSFALDAVDVLKACPGYMSKALDIYLTI